MRATLDGIARSEGAYRGTAIIDEIYTDKDFERMHDGGIRGVRFNFVQHLGGRPDMGFFQQHRRAAEGDGLAPDPAPRRQDLVEFREHVPADCRCRWSSTTWAGSRPRTAWSSSLSRCCSIS